jgi:hypothetical protein
MGRQDYSFISAAARPATNVIWAELAEAGAVQTITRELRERAAACNTSAYAATARLPALTPRHHRQPSRHRRDHNR